MKKTLVVTTINKPNKNIRALINLCKKYNSDFIIIGDKKSPKKFKVDHALFYDLKRQLKLNLYFSKICPINSYARKNIGYLIATKKGNQVIIETDDDNYPKKIFFKNIKLNHYVEELNNYTWVNVYKKFLLKKMEVWPRGLPLNKININPIFKKKKVKKDFFLQQGVCEGNPDVDAIFRILNEKINIKFKKNFKFSLGKATSPLNSQNTIWFKKVFPLLYLPVTCSMRATDIWRGFIALNIIKKDNMNVLFFGTTMKQIRNIHNLANDLKQEMPLFQDVIKGVNILQNTRFKKGSKNYLDNLFKSYKVLIDNKIFKKKELFYLNAWIKDVKKLFRILN